MRISKRVRAIAPSLTLAVTQRAVKMRAEGKDVIGFGAGEPDFDTPDYIKQATIAALSRGVGKYTHVAGTIELRKAAAEELSAAHGIRRSAEEVIVSSGAKHSLFNLFMALLDEGDEVIIPSPCWVSYPELVAMAGGRPVILPTFPEEDFRVDPERLAALLSPRTRAVVLCSPSNPTGALYDAETLRGIARAVERHGNPETFIVTDDIYRRLVYRGTWTSICQVAPDLEKQVILVDGVSKSYAMTGWRVGFCAAPRELVEAMTTLQGQSTTNAAAISQAAALAAITGPQDTVEAMRREFDKRRRAMIAALGAIPGVKCTDPAGAFYAFPDVSAFLDPGRGLADDVALAERLLEQVLVAVVPGTGFLAPGFFRLSYATSMKNIEEGVRRLAEGLAAVKAG